MNLAPVPWGAVGIVVVVMIALAALGYPRFAFWLGAAGVIIYLLKVKVG